MDQFSSTSDKDLKVLYNSVKAEIKRRKETRKADQKKKWNDYLKVHFPSTQIGGKCQVKQLIHQEGFPVRVILKFTPNQAVTGLKDLKPPPYKARFEKTFEQYELKIDFYPGNSSGFFPYATDRDGTGPLYPSKINPHRRCDKHFPLEILALPWIGELIQNPQGLHAMFTKMDDVNTPDVFSGVESW